MNQKALKQLCELEISIDREGADLNRNTFPQNRHLVNFATSLMDRLMPPFHKACGIKTNCSWMAETWSQLMSLTG